MYKVQSTEKTSGSGSDHETKALLYLMSRDKEKKIEFFIIDFYNDLTATTNFDDYVWDLQSKAKQKPSATEIGKNLVTLYKNYVSDFKFNAFILFGNEIRPKLLLNDGLDCFYYDNFNEDARSKIRQSLIDECISKAYIDDEKITAELIDSFLNQVIFVTYTKTKEESVKSVIDVDLKRMPDNAKLLEIFKEIRSVQMDKKSVSVENKILNSFSEYRNYAHEFSSGEIRLMILCRLLNFGNIINTNPPSFGVYLKSLDELQVKDLLFNCQSSISRMMFDSGMVDYFWPFFNNVSQVILENPGDSIDFLYTKLDDKLYRRIYHLNVYSVKFFIAMVKDGLNDN